MTLKSTLVALVVGLVSGAGATTANAAPLAAAPAVAEAGVTTVGYRYGFHGKRFGKRIHGKSLYKRSYHRPYKVKCTFKRRKVYSKYHHGFIWKKRKVCYRAYH